MNDTTILLIAKDERLAASVQGAVASLAGLRLETVGSCAWAPSWHGSVDPALVLIHVATPADAEGAAALLRHLSGAHQAVATLLLCEADAADEGLKLLRLGAADCLMRPLDLTRLVYLVDVLTIRHRLTPRAAAGRLGESRPFIYRDDGRLGQIMEQVRRVAPLETSILIQGETGTGKTRLAQLIHDSSPRQQDPFLTVDCGALSANVIESELFGHVRGAFTGADRERTGKFAAVGAGTLFLDDIDGLPLELQPKLLRAIEERVFEPVGSNKQLPLRARVIAASNLSLETAAEAGRFRKDLYYRLAVMVFYLPPFRENQAQVAALAQHFVTEYAARYGRPVRGLTPQALAALEEYDWPGNVRELRNVIERAVALCPGPWINLEDLPGRLQRALTPASVPAATGLPPFPVEPTPVVTSAEGTRVAETEAEVIRAVLLRNRNNKLRTAAELGISRMTLYKRLHQYGLIGPNSELELV